MTATDKLRRLLDERGVEWTEPNNDERSRTTYWTAGLLSCTAVEFDDGVVNVSLTAYRVTPELAIKATLGSGECTDTGRYCFTCSECGWTANEPRHALGGFSPNFCPNCGRAVKA